MSGCRKYSGIHNKLMTSHSKSSPLLTTGAGGHSSSPSYCNQLTRGTTFLAVQGPTCAQGEFAGTLDLDDYLVYVKLWKYGTRKDVSCKLKICPVYLLFEKVELRLAPSPELKILEKGRCRDLQPFFAHL